MILHRCSVSGKVIMSEYIAQRKLAKYRTQKGYYKCPHCKQYHLTSKSR